MPHRSQRFIVPLLLALFLCALPAAWAAPPARVVYTVSVADIPNKLYRVEARAEGLRDPSVSFAIPAWTPGYYVLTHFHKNLQNVTATGPGGRTLTVTATDPQTWRVETGGATRVTLTYEVRAVDRNFGFFHTYLGERNGFINGPAALVYVVDGKTAPCRITYRVPDGWRVASANDPVRGDPYTFTAPDYDALADHPADLGEFRRIDRRLRGVPFSILLVGAEGEDADAFIESVFRISEAGMRVFRSAPFPRYLYHFRFTGRRGASGLEHRNSTVITMGRDALRRRSAPAIVAHEFIHAWNVKRVRPRALGPFDYTREVRVKDLWWAEGVTEYYTPRLMVAAGLQSRDYWHGYLAAAITELQNNAARRHVTLEQASLKAWEGGSVGFGGLSYYNKGMVVGLLLDIEMRRRTKNRVGLDDLMLRLLRDAERTGRGFPEGGIEAAAAALTGTDFQPFFDKALRSTEEMPLRETLAAAGLDLEETVTALPFLGVTWDLSGTPRNEGVRVGAVLPESAAERAGLRAGDVIVVVEGKPVANARGNLFPDKKPGDTVTLGVRREGEAPQPIAVTLGRREQRAYRIQEKPDATPQQRAMLATMTGAASR